MKKLTCNLARALVSASMVFLPACGDSKKSKRGGSSADGTGYQNAILEDFPFPESDITLREQGVSVTFSRGSVGESLSPALRVAAQPSFPLPAGISAVSVEVQLDSGGPAFAATSHARAPILEIDIGAAAGDLRTQKGVVLLTRTPSGAPDLHGSARATDQWVTRLSKIDPDSRKLRFPIPALPKNSHYLVAKLSAGQIRQNRAQAPLRSARSAGAANAEDAAASPAAPRAPAASELYIRISTQFSPTPKPSPQGGWQG